MESVLKECVSFNHLYGRKALIDKNYYPLEILERIANLDPESDEIQNFYARAYKRNVNIFKPEPSESFHTHIHPTIPIAYYFCCGGLGGESRLTKVIQVCRIILKIFKELDKLELGIRILKLDIDVVSEAPYATFQFRIGDTVLEKIELRMFHFLFPECPGYPFFEKYLDEVISKIKGPNGQNIHIIRCDWEKQ